MLPGHSILARVASSGCPTALSTEHLEGLHLALPRIADLLQAEYRASNVLVSSLRGSVPHVHLHLVPLVPEVEAAWRQHTGWEKGHLHEFLGHHENVCFVRNLRERLDKGWTTDEQISDHAERLSEQTKRLREALSGTA
jgi:diadenosine tetraphosphate (Ap4A) HIT family hydrolase